jgi:hypothetical protein
MINDAAPIYVTTATVDPVIDLETHGRTETVAALYYNGLIQPAGFYSTNEEPGRATRSPISLSTRREQCCTARRWRTQGPAYLISGKQLVAPCDESTVSR